MFTGYDITDSHIPPDTVIGDMYADLPIEHVTISDQHKAYGKLHKLTSRSAVYTVSSTSVTPPELL